MAQIPFNPGPETSQAIALSVHMRFEMKSGGWQWSLMME